MSSVVFAYPWSSPTTQVQLRAPQLGDAFRLNSKVHVRTAMDGSLRAYKHTPSKISKEMDFLGISLSKALEMKTFIALTQGKLVRFLDWEDVQWRGYILTEPTDFKIRARGLGNEPRPEDVEFSITFEGVQLG